MRVAARTSAADPFAGGLKKLAILHVVFPIGMRLVSSPPYLRGTARRKPQLSTEVAMDSEFLPVPAGSS
jgi:hypothetical protein